MKLANIYPTVNGSLKGQSATGESDAGCIDVKAHYGGAMRDIEQIVVTDAAAMPTVISRRLTGSKVADFKYVAGRITSSKATRTLCSAMKVGSYYRFAGGMDAWYKVDGSLSQSKTLLSVWSSSSGGWEITVETDGRLKIYSKYSGNTATGYGGTIPNDGEYHHIEVRGSAALPSSNPCYYTGGSRVAYSIDGGTWTYFKTSSDSQVLLQCSYGIDSTIYIGDSQIFEKGSIKMCGANGNTSVTWVSLGIQDATIGSTSITSSDSITYNISSGGVQQHYTDTHEWVQ